MATAQRNFQLGILPERKIDRRALVTSYSIVVVVLLLLINLNLILPEKLTLRQYHVVELIPTPSLSPEPEPIKVKPQVQKVKLLPAVKAPVFDTPKLVVPHEVRHEVEKPVEAPKVVVNQFAAPQIKMAVGGARPQLVHTGDFGGSSKVPTVNAPVEKVQTGGFGDPNGLPGKGDPNKTTNVNRLGSPALPGGPGYGNGTGGDKGARGVVASTGFGNGIANPPQGGGKQGVVQSSGFANQTVASDAPKKKASADSGTSQVDILSKPRPEYTAEGRALKLEGDVVIDLIFLANGSVQVNHVVSGLGHGLDESAVQAAQQIKFKPAKRDGEAVDFPARVRIEFRLAY